MKWRVWTTKKQVTTENITTKSKRILLGRTYYKRSKGTRREQHELQKWFSYETNDTEWSCHGDIKCIMSKDTWPFSKRRAHRIRNWTETWIWNKSNDRCNGWRVWEQRYGWRWSLSSFRDCLNTRFPSSHIRQCICPLIKYLTVKVNEQSRALTNPTRIDVTQSFCFCFLPELKSFR